MFVIFPTILNQVEQQLRQGFLKILYTVINFRREMGEKKYRISSNYR